MGKKGKERKKKRKEWNGREGKEGEGKPLTTIAFCDRRRQISSATEKKKNISRPRIWEARFCHEDQLNVMEGRRINLQESVSTLAFEFDWPDVHQSHRRQGCYLKTELHPTHGTSAGYSESGHTLHLTSPFPNGVLFSCILLPPPLLSYLGLLDRVQDRIQRLARLKAPDGAA